MKKNVNKLATLALTGMMMAGMSFSALAADAPERGNGDGKWDGTTTSTTFSFKKYLDMKEDYTSVPHVKFSFETKTGNLDDDTPWDTHSSTLANPVQIEGTGELVDRDDPTKGYTLPVYYGEAGLKAEVQFGQNADGSADTEVVKTVTFKDADGNDVAFTKSGIYRFGITEKWASDGNKDLYVVTYTPDGGTETYNRSVKLNTNGVKFIDVYVKENTETGADGGSTTTYSISNVVLLTAQPANTSMKADENNKLEYGTVKLSGINNEYTTKHEKVPGGPDEEDNKISIEKDLAGSFENKSEDFTFTVTFTNVPSDFKVTKQYYTKDASGNWTEETTEKNGTVTVDTSKSIEVVLKDDEKVELTGLPAGVKYKVAETSNSNYKATAKLDDADQTLVDGGWTLDRSTEGLTTDDFVDNIVWTNTREEITVTGVAMNVAPYAAMVLGAGAFAGIFLGGKRRRAEDED